VAIITISRGSFTGGRTVAELLGKRLQQAVVSREEVLARAAREYEISEDELVRALNESPSFWQQVMGKRIAYVNTLAAVLLEQASQGDLVYHGYVGHLLFPGITHVLRVRVIADMEYRVRSAMSEAKLTRDVALTRIRQRDSERRRWAQLLYGVDWEDPTQYNVVLNLAQISPASAVETIMRMSELPEFKPTTESQKRFDDLRLSCRVWGAIAKNPKTRSAGVQVTSDGGRITISGDVGSAKVLNLIPQLAEKVSGVTAVQCDAGMGIDWCL
jgi:cytidylate kinase